MANGEHKPGYALADRSREKFNGQRGKRTRSLEKAFPDEWEVPTGVEMVPIETPPKSISPYALVPIINRVPKRGRPYVVGIVAGAVIALALAGVDIDVPSLLKMILAQ